MRKLLLLLVLLSGCHPQAKPEPGPEPGPIPEPGTDCEAMCEHIGPQGLNCEEGLPLYDFDLPGTVGIPNQTCVGFCEKQQANGVNLYPQCVVRATSCEAIEAARQNCEL